jgi:hypothetical protein
MVVIMYHTEKKRRIILVEEKRCRDNDKHYPISGDRRHDLLGRCARTKKTNHRSVEGIANTTQSERSEIQQRVEAHGSARFGSGRMEL